jgi:CDP-glucose 4,6-dehydratase
VGAAVRAAYLKLDCAKAAARLGWRPLIELDQALELTVEWYRGLAAGADMRALRLAQMRRCCSRSPDGAQA